MRTKTEVDSNILQTVIETAEKDGPLKNLSALWITASELYNNSISGNPVLKPLTCSQIMLRVKELGIIIKTQPGRKGEMTPEQLAAMKAGRGPRISRGDKFASDETKVAHFNRLEQTVPPRALSLVQSCKDGSMKAAIKLFCLQCMNYDVNGVRECTASVGACPCPIWAYRPYQENNTEVTEVAENFGVPEASPVKIIESENVVSGS